jgi:hypothetical protein
MKIGSAKGFALYFTSMLVLVLAFFSSLLGGVGTLGEEWRTVGILEANPNSYVDWIRAILEYGILPTATSLVLLIIDFAVQGKTRTRGLNLLLLIVGGFFALWGIYYFLASYRSYAEAINLANQWNVKGINTPLQIIYIGYGSVGLLLSVAGLFILVTSGYLMHARQPVDTQFRINYSKNCQVTRLPMELENQMPLLPQ